jgi:hypothetical protein
MKSLKTRWRLAFPDHHDDPWMNTLISKWLEGFRYFLRENKGDKFCQHGTAGESDTITGAPEYYTSLVNSMFQSDLQATDATDLKALLMLSCPPRADVKSTGWFYPWNGSSSTGGWHELQGKVLVNALKSMAPSLNVDSVPTSIRMPLCPSFPFLCSLYLLFRELEAQDGGIIDYNIPFEIAGVGHVGPYRLSIPLKVDTDKEFGLGRKWIEKCLTGKSDWEKKGVCAALWAVMRAQVAVNGVAGSNFLSDEKSPKSGEVDEQRKIPETERALLRVFQGPGHPVAGVGFAPHYVHIYWS